MIPKIIGITGKKFHGKDTVGNYFVTKHRFERIAFADPLKQACQSIFGFTYDQLYGDQKEVIDEYWGKTPRDIFQFVGTDLFRNQFSKSIWIDSIKRKITSAPSQHFVITDVRFPNEAALIKELDGIIIKVVRNIPDDMSSLHESETHDIVPDFIIQNDSSISDCYTSINKLMYYEYGQKCSCGCSHLTWNDMWD